MNNIRIVEVGPRDGLQNEKQTILTGVKLKFVQMLVDSGLTMIEATSFVSPKWVPQLADHRELMSELPSLHDVRFPVLVPNEKGLDLAIELGLKDIAVFTAATDAFSKKNMNCTIEESLVRYRDLIAKAKSNDMKVRGYVSCTLGCPYEGTVEQNQVTKISKALLEMGCYEVSLGDTIGVGTPIKAKAMLKSVASEVPIESLAIHFHDTFGQAIANIYACLDLGITTIDASVAGLGGCPYAKGASGNVATEEVVYLLHGLGLNTNVKLNNLIEAGRYICDHLGHPPRSKVALAHPQGDMQ